MRPVNLIPSEDRPGGHRPMRGGPLAYIVVGALSPPCSGTSVLVVTENQIADRKAEVVQLKAETATAEAKAARPSTPTPSSTASANSASPRSPASPTAASTGSG